MGEGTGSGRLQSVAAVVGIIGVVITLLAWLHPFAPDDPPATSAPKTSTSTPSQPLVPSSPSQPSPEAEPEIYLNRTKVPVCGSFTVSGTGFLPKEPIKIMIAAFELGSTVAGGSGAFGAVSYKVPPTFQLAPVPRSVTVHARGSRSGKFASADLTIPADSNWARPVPDC